MTFLKNYWPFLLWLSIILYLSFTPLKDWPKPTVLQKLYFDKLVHITMYAILIFLLLRGIFRQQKKQPFRYGLIMGSVLFIAGTGITIEFLQPVLTEYRQFEWLDLMANAAGAVAGWYVFKWVSSKGWLGLSTMSND